MLEQNDPAFLSELVATLIKLAGGEVMLGEADSIGPHDLRFIECVDDVTGKRFLRLQVVEHTSSMN